MSIADTTRPTAPERWVETVGRSIKGSDTPQSTTAAGLRSATPAASGSSAPASSGSPTTAAPTRG